MELALETRECADVSKVKTPPTPSLNSDDSDDALTIVTSTWAPLAKAESLAGTSGDVHPAVGKEMVSWGGRA